MTAFATLGGLTVNTVDLVFPLYGAWAGDVTMSGPVLPTLPTQLVIGQLTLQCAALRAGAFTGMTTVRVVGGFGGWRTVIPAQAYSNPGGLFASLLLGDAAAAVGEQVVITPDYVVGSSFTRRTAPASRVLSRLAGSLWWIDPPTGITQIAPVRPTSVIQTDFQVEDYNPGKGLLHIATENPNNWMPGNTFANANILSPLTISTTRLQSDDKGKLRVSVMVSP
jgi:hypothetical protein